MKRDAKVITRNYNATEERRKEKKVDKSWEKEETNGLTNFGSVHDLVFAVRGFDDLHFRVIGSGVFDHVS